MRDHVDGFLRTGLDTILAGLVWNGPDGDAVRADPRSVGEDPSSWWGVLLVCPPDRAGALASAWRAVRPRLHELRAPFDEHAAAPDGWINTAGRFVNLLEDWGRVLVEADRRGRGVVGLSG